MITKQLWQCPPGLIDQALKEFPIVETTVLNEPTGNFFYDKWKIKDFFKDTVWQQVLDTLPYTIGQARIIKIDPGESYMAHADIDNRWHLNLTGEQSYLIDLDNKFMHECVRDHHWAYMDASRLHAATNYGSIPRLQLVIRELLVSSSNTNMISITIAPAYTQSDFRYKFDNVLSPFLNRVNQTGKLANFNHNLSSSNFKLATDMLDEFKELITQDFQVTYD